MTVCCAKCGRPLFEDRYGDFTGKPQACEPSCEQMRRDIETVRRKVFDPVAQQDSAARS